VDFEEDNPRPKSRPVLNQRRRGALPITLAVLGVLVLGAVGFSLVWTDVLWFRHLGFSVVYRTEVFTRVGLFVVGALVMGGAVAGSLILAYRNRPVYALSSPEQASLERYRTSIEPLRRLVAVVAPVMFGLFAGSTASQQWQTFLIWWNRSSFGQKDPQFHLDIGFYVFTLPWLQFLVSFFSGVLLLSGLVALITHYLYGGIRLNGPGPRFTAAARIQLGSLIAAFLLLRGLDFWLGAYALTTRQSELITGLTYTDARAVVTARGVLAAISVIVAVLFIIAAFFDGWRAVPMYGVGLLVISAIIVGQLYPAFVQRFQATPNAQVKEAPYIERNINATRAAYGLSDVEVTRYAARTEASPDALRNDASKIPGIRLMDPALISPTFRQLEQNKQYYAFADSLDVDRYVIDGSVRDTVIAVREVDLEDAPQDQRNWVNDHIVYTHGFGVVAAYGNQRTSDGKPVFFQSGIPSSGELGEFEPRVYFGEQSPTYSIVGAPEGASQRELDFPDDKSDRGQRNTTYTGTGGVPMGSLLGQSMYAIKFLDQNILLSDAVNSESRIMYDRSPRERVGKVAPWLTLDGDPYPAVIDGRVLWIVDGYTTTNSYPYSTIKDLNTATSDSITESTQSVTSLRSQQVNYIRNSVKATVDAYSGEVTLYAWDESDPVLRTWMKVFPGTVKPLSDISSELMSHVRYPEDLFKVQRDLLSRYHVTDAEAFFGQQDFWKMPDDPTESAATTQVQPPYYLTLQMPGQDSASFSLTSTYIPTSGTNTRNVLTGFLAVDADAGSTAGERAEGYGKIRLLELPRDSVVPGPGQVQNNFNADPTVSQALNLLRQGQSTVKYGNLLTLPMGGGLLYVEPVYVQGAGDSSYPLLQRVLVAFGDKIGFADTLDEAIKQVFTGTGTSDDDTSTPGTPEESTAQADLERALQDANTAIKASEEALKAGDFAAYGKAQDQLKDAINRALAAEARLEETGASPTATASPTTGG
jgi:uncharacterized membrane protein (UPF0182 family)